MPPPPVLDAMTGGQLPLAGDLPLLCNRGVVTADGLALLREARMPLPGEIIPVGDYTEHRAALARFRRSGWKVVVQHVYPDSEIDPAQCWVSPAQLSWLNNKANLGALVPKPFLPERRVLDRGQLGAVAGPWPVVLKVATDYSTGGGFDVAVCRSADELAARARELDGDRFVVEQFLNFRRSLCLQVWIGRDGAVQWLGGSEQIVDAAGRYQGNLLVRGAALPFPVRNAVEDVARRGAGRGYFGCLGVDVAEMPDGRWLVFDLNFRLNASTTLLTVAASGHSGLDAPLVWSGAWRGTGSFAALLRAAGKAIDRGWLVPFSTFDTELGGWPGAPPMIYGAVPAGSRAELEDRLRGLDQLGLE